MPAKIKTAKILIKRGEKENIPILDEGELALTTDTEQMYIGTKSGNKELAVSGVEQGLLKEVDFDPATGVMIVEIT